MRYLYIVICLFTFISCKQEKRDLSYEIVKKRIFIDRHCSYEIHFPEIVDLDYIELQQLYNQLFENIADAEYHLQKCYREDEGHEVRNLVQDYEILFASEKILSVEFQLTRGGEFMHYIPILLPLHPPENEAQLLGGFEFEASIFGDDWRERIYEAVPEHHYKPELKRTLLTAYDGKNIIVYTGGEGEFFGWEKIKIPINGR